MKVLYPFCLFLRKTGRFQKNSENLEYFQFSYPHHCDYCPVQCGLLHAASPEIPLLLPERCSGLSVREGEAQVCSCNPNSP